MTDETDIQKLAEELTSAMAMTTAEKVQPLMHGFIIAVPYKVMESVNMLMLKDPRFTDALRRHHGWQETQNRVSWSHVVPEIEGLMRAAAAWRSSPLGADHARNQAPEPWFRVLVNCSGERRNACRTASEKLGNRAFLNKDGGVALNVRSQDPWPDDIQGLVDAGRDLKKTQYIVLCEDGRVIEGLPTWPRL